MWICAVRADTNSRRHSGTVAVICLAWMGAVRFERPALADGNSRQREP